MCHLLVLYVLQTSDASIFYKHQLFLIKNLSLERSVDDADLIAALPGMLAVSTKRETKIRSFFIEPRTVTP